MLYFLRKIEINHTKKQTIIQNMGDLLTAFSSLSVSQPRREWTITKIQFRVLNTCPITECIIEIITIQYLSYIVIIDLIESRFTFRTLHIEASFDLHDIHINVFLRHNSIHTISNVEISPTIEFIQSQIYEENTYQKGKRHRMNCSRSLTDALYTFAVYHIDLLIE